MNNQQKILIWVGLALVMAVLYFPPWLFIWEGHMGQEAEYAGYHPIFSPPAYEGDDLKPGVQIDTLRLAAEIFVVIVLTAVMILFFRR